MKTYLDFLRAKMPKAEMDGFEPLTAPHPSLFPHQRDISLWGIRGGRRAIFADFGLGKTRIHLQLAKWVTEKTGGKFLIIAPLGVRQEFTRCDGPAMGIPVHFVRTTAEVEAIHERVFVTNYESVREGKIDLSLFSGAGLDEASVLRSYGSKTYQTFLPLFKNIPYRFVFTATPSPNRYKELIHYGGFLGVMDTGEALTRFFQRDSSQAGNLTLYPHMVGKFHAWLASWAAFVTSPADLGHDATGYDLPEMRVHWHRLEVDHTAAWTQTDSWGQTQMFADQALGLKESAAVKSSTIAARVAKAREIVAADDPAAHWLLWHDLEAERHAVSREFPEARTVYGSQDLEEREDLILGFSRGEFPMLATKPVIAGSGCNFQRHCSRSIFLGAGYKFNDFIQAIHRIHRFQQSAPVDIHIISMASEDGIVAELKAKWKRHDELRGSMRELVRNHHLNPPTDMELIKSLLDGRDRAEVRGERFRAIHNDCVLETAAWQENSVDFISTSIPFGNQYEYSPSFNDFGHNPDNGAFFAQMEHLVPNLLRVLRPGRIAAIHVKDRIRFGNVTGDGFPTVDPFSDDTVAAFRKHGFRFIARITIDTDVVRENAQTYRLGWSENAKDSTKMGAGMPEYVLIFRKLPSDTSDGYADTPVTKDKGEYTRGDWQLDAAGLWRSDGDRLPDPEILMHMPLENLRRLWISHSTAGGYNHEEHAKLCRALDSMGKLPTRHMLFPAVSRNADVWTDINRISTLNSQQHRRNQENHVCPLQLDIIRRLITRYTNAGDIVFDPFGGIGSVPYQAVRMGRTGWMTELNADYWKCAVGYCEAAENEVAAPTLFDLANPEKQPSA